jgi:hypothetical protein
VSGDRGATRVSKKARAMSSRWTSGRHGLFSSTRPVVWAHAVRLLSITSNRSRGETPLPVALRR